MNATTQMVMVISGSSDGRFACTGKQVETVRDALVDAFNIPDDAIAFINGKRVEMSQLLQANDVLEFIRPCGRKGINRMLTQTEIRREYVGVPKDVLDDLFAAFPHDDRNADGEHIWLESVVDGWLADRYSRGRIADDGADKVIPPSSVRLKGQVYEGFTRLEWRLLDAIVGKPGVKQDEVIEHVYGHDAEGKENALTQTIKRLNTKLMEMRCPVIVGAINGFVSLTS